MRRTPRKANTKKLYLWERGAHPLHPLPRFAPVHGVFDLDGHYLSVFKSIDFSCGPIQIPNKDKFNLIHDEAFFSSTSSIQRSIKRTPTATCPLKRCATASSRVRRYFTTPTSIPCWISTPSASFKRSLASSTTDGQTSHSKTTWRRASSTSNVGSTYFCISSWSDSGSESMESKQP